MHHSQTKASHSLKRTDQLGFHAATNRIRTAKNFIRETKDLDGGYAYWVRGKDGRDVKVAEYIPEENLHGHETPPQYLVHEVVLNEVLHSIEV